MDDLNNHLDVAEGLPTPNLMFSEFAQFTESSLYIDKTLMLKSIIDTCSGQDVLLFPRPRRFGKTLMMSTLKSFFEKPGTASDIPASMDTSLLFRNRKIWACGEKYREEQGKYPVIYLTFKDVKASSWDGLYEVFCRLLRLEVSRHPEILQSDRCLSIDIRFMKNLLDGRFSKAETEGTLEVLTRMLSMHYGAPAVIIIDEYDTPFQEGALHGCYENVERFMTRLLSGGMKDNSYLQHGFLAGILRVVMAGIFGGLNNVVTWSIFDRRYSTCFGFTEEEVQQIARLYGKEDKYPEICEWYGGYLFGETRIFNPWSVLNYFDQDCKPRAYWTDTESTSAVMPLLENASDYTIAQLMQILNWEPGQEPVSARIDDSVEYPKVGSSYTDLLSFLLMTGFLRGEKVKDRSKNTYFYDLYDLYDLHIPNREVREFFEKEISNRLIPESPSRDRLLEDLQSAIIHGDPSGFQPALEQLLQKTKSSFALADEDSCLILLLCLIQKMRSQFIITFNLEYGDGRHDIQLEPRSRSGPGILLEVKQVKEDNYKRIRLVLKNRAQKAIKRALDNHYDAELKKRSIQPILVYGVAFYKKNAGVQLKHPESV